MHTGNHRCSTALAAKMWPLSAALLAIALSACSGPAATPITIPPPVLTGLPPLPHDRDVSTPLGHEQLGAEAFERSGNTTIDGSDLQLTSATDAMSWGIWRFAADDDALLSVEVAFDAVEGSGVYVGLANYAKGRWDLDGPLSSGQSFELSDAVHRSPGGAVYVLLLCYGGDTAQVERVVFVTERLGWQIVTLDDAGQTGLYTSLAVIAGNPAIAYHAAAPFNDLKYAISSTATGHEAGIWEVVTVDSAQIVGQDCSLAEVAGSPAISYYDSTAGDLMFARSLTPTGGLATDWSSVRVDGADSDVGQHTALAIVAGNPAIAYQQLGQFDLLYARSTSPTGSLTEDWDVTTVQSVGDSGFFSSLAIVDGHPAIAHWNATANAVEYCRSAAPTGLGEEVPLWSSTTVLQVPEMTGRLSLAVVADNPAIALVDADALQLRFVRSNSLQGAAPADWAGAVTLTAGAVSGACSLSLFGQLPAVSYFDDDANDLRLAQSDSVDGSQLADWQTSPVDTAGTAGSHSSVAIVDGRLAISYQFNSIDVVALRYAILFD